MAAATTVDRILDAADDLFDRRGFHAVGIDELAARAEVSTRTLYKHLQSKNGLIVTVLSARRARFFATVAAEDRGIAELFDALADWFEREGAHGCLFLRALAEFGEHPGPIPDEVAHYDQQLRAEVRARLERAGAADCDALVDQVVVLFEGAASAAVRMGPSAARRAGAAAATLLATNLESSS